MDLGLSEQQELLKNAAREFLENECPEQHVRDMEEDERGYSPELWGQMAEQGWQGLLIPEEHGGVGFDFLDMCVLLDYSVSSILLFLSVSFLYLNIDFQNNCSENRGNTTQS